MNVLTRYPQHIIPSGTTLLHSSQQSSGRTTLDSFRVRMHDHSHSLLKLAMNKSERHACIYLSCQFTLENLTQRRNSERVSRLKNKVPWCRCGTARVYALNALPSTTIMCLGLHDTTTTPHTRRTRVRHRATDGTPARRTPAASSQPRSAIFTWCPPSRSADRTMISPEEQWVQGGLRHHARSTLPIYKLVEHQCQGFVANARGQYLHSLWYVLREPFCAHDRIHTCTC